MNISSQNVYRRQDYQFARQRADRMYIPLEQSRPVFGFGLGIRRGDIAAAVAVILLGILAFPAAELLSAIVAKL